MHLIVTAWQSYSDTLLAKMNGFVCRRNAFFFFEMKNSTFLFLCLAVSYLPIFLFPVKQTRVCVSIILFSLAFQGLLDGYQIQQYTCPFSFDMNETGLHFCEAAICYMFDFMPSSTSSSLSFELFLLALFEYCHCRMRCSLFKFFQYCKSIYTVCI